MYSTITNSTVCAHVLVLGATVKVRPGSMVGETECYFLNDTTLSLSLRPTGAH